MAEIFGIPVLVLGFTFSSAYHYFDKRMSLIRAQADVITQVYQSSKYLSTADQIAVRNSLKEILADRLSIYQDVHTFVVLNANVGHLGNKFNELMILSIPRALINSRELANNILRPQTDRLMKAIRVGILMLNTIRPPF